MLKEPCGAQVGYEKARIFAYEGTNATPTTSRNGCYAAQDHLGYKYTERCTAAGVCEPHAMAIYESDRTYIGNVLVRLPVDQMFSPEHYFLPLDNDPRNERPKIEALAVGEVNVGRGTYPITVGITRQPCPVDANWLLARHIPEASADNHERCWRESGDKVEVRDFDYGSNPLKLLDTATNIDKAAFFDAGSVHAVPRKYIWPQ